MQLRKFLSLHLDRGEMKAIAHQAGIHPNTVYSWVKNRNNPHIMSLVWFFRSIAKTKNKSYELLWLEFLYLLEGEEDPQQRVRLWVESIKNEG
jgi:hypothetical protein